MKNKRLEERRKKISKDTELFVSRSFEIVDRIHEILKLQGKEQKDLAKDLGKTESEISKWMSGTHNFTIKTLSKIESVLGVSILNVAHTKKVDHKNIVLINYPSFAFKASDTRIMIHHKMNTTLKKSTQFTGSELN